jgi:hypothetical protein
MTTRKLLAMADPRVYDADQVDRYVAELQSEVATLRQQLATLHDEVALSAVATRDEAAERALGRALIQAQYAADRSADEAAQEAERLLEEAHRQRLDLLDRARQEHDRLLDAARREGNSIVEQARVEAERLAIETRREPARFNGAPRQPAPAGRPDAAEPPQWASAGSPGGGHVKWRAPQTPFFPALDGLPTSCTQRPLFGPPACRRPHHPRRRRPEP